MSAASKLIDGLISELGADHVSTEPELLRRLSHDIYARGNLPLAVARPADAGQVARAVALIHGADHAVIPRGGGSSYTGGYLPPHGRCVTLDLRRLDQVLEIDEENLLVRVQAGCTWRALKDALEPSGLRPPFWGPLSGRVATIGGSLSQNSILLGSGSFGASPESVLGLRVILAGGRELATGSLASRRAPAFFRHYGPDLSGLFLGDTGALGIKVEAALRLLPVPQAARFASFVFPARGPMVRAMARLGRERLTSYCFGMDPVLQAQRMQRKSIAEDLTALKNVARGSGGLGRGLREAARIVGAGRRFLAEGDHSIHLVIEGRSDADAEEQLSLVRRIASQNDGKEVANTIPKVIHADPFVPMSTAIGPRGERWSPVHGILPASRAEQTWDRIATALSEIEEELSAAGVLIGVLTAVVAPNALAVEPVFYWPGPRPPVYDELLSAEEISRLSDFDPQPAAAELVDRAREMIKKIFLESGAAHLQIARTYPYREGIAEGSWAALEELKKALDPKGLLNPGSLGLGESAGD